MVEKQDWLFASTRSVQIATASTHALIENVRSFASTRSVQIATSITVTIAVEIHLCLHTLRADCNQPMDGIQLSLFGFASTRSVQIATAEMHRIAICTFQNVC